MQCESFGPALTRPAATLSRKRERGQFLSLWERTQVRETQVRGRSKLAFPTRSFYSLAVSNIKLARQLRKSETWAEKLLWRWLRDRRFNGYKFRRQHPVGIYCLDFFCHAARLNIELDGSQHGFPEGRAHDLERESFLKSQGIKTLRFWNTHLRRDAESIRDTIFLELHAQAPLPLPSPRPTPACGRGRRA